MRRIRGKIEPGKFTTQIDEYIDTQATWRREHTDDICVCGHRATELRSRHGADIDPSYHDANQGTRCRAPFKDCKCEKLEKRN